MVMLPALLDTFCSAVVAALDVLETAVLLIDAFCVDIPVVPMVIEAGVVGPAAKAAAVTADKAKKMADFMVILQKRVWVQVFPTAPQIQAVGRFDNTF